MACSMQRIEQKLLESRKRGLGHDSIYICLVAEQGILRVAFTSQQVRSVGRARSKVAGEVGKGTVYNGIIILFDSFTAKIEYSFGCCE